MTAIAGQTQWGHAELADKETIQRSVCLIGVNGGFGCYSLHVDLVHAPMV